MSNAELPSPVDSYNSLSHAGSSHQSWKPLRRNTGLSVSKTPGLVHQAYPLPSPSAVVGEHEHGGVAHLPGSTGSGGGIGARKLLILACTHLLILLVVLAPAVAVVFLARIPDNKQDAGDSYNAGFRHCNADGSFTANDTPTFSLWNPAGFFQITLFWGRFSFATAKLIDIIWDVVVGRGIQALLAWIAYAVFSRSLSRTMEAAPVSYHTFEALAFVPPTLRHTVYLTRDLLTNRGLRARLTVVWIVFSAAFVLVFPTLVGAMSGYSTNSQAFMKDYQNDLVPWRNYSMVQFSIADGWRIGLTGSLAITDSYNPALSCKTRGPQWFHYEVNPATGLQEAVPVANKTEAWAQVPKNCSLFWRTVEYANTYGFDAIDNTSSIFKLNDTVINLPAPALNITSSFAPGDFEKLAVYLTGGGDDDDDDDSTTSTYTPEYIYESPELVSWVFRNQSYPISYVTAHGLCLPTYGHNWGFSYLLLFVTTLLTAIWSLAMYGIWLDAYLHSRLDRARRHLGTYRASYDLASALFRDLGEDRVTDTSSDAQIRQHVRKDLDSGGRIGYEQILDQQPEPLQLQVQLPPSRWDELKVWWRHERQQQQNHGLNHLRQRRRGTDSTLTSPSWTDQEHKDLPTPNSWQGSGLLTSPPPQYSNFPFRYDLGD